MALLNTAQKLVPVLLIIVSLMLIVMLQFGFIFLLLALLPSIAAYFVDTDPSRPAFRTVFAANLAATLPSLTPMFKSGLKFKHYEVGGIIGDPKVWMLIYGSAAAGWCIIFICRQIARTMLAFQYEFRAASLERAQARLVDEWGTQVRQLTEVAETEI